MSETANQTDKKEFGWSDVDESPVISTVVPTQEPPTVDLSASVSNLLKPESEEKPEQKTHDVSAAESSEEKTELNQEMIEALLNKLMEFDDMPPLVDDEIPELVYDSCPRCDAALKVLLSNRHPVINVESDSEESEESQDSEDSEESQGSEDSEESPESDSDYIPSDSDSEPPTPRTLAYRQVNVPSAIQYITVILALVYLFKFYFFMNESRIRYRPCT